MTSKCAIWTDDKFEFYLINTFSLEKLPHTNVVRLCDVVKTNLSDKHIRSFGIDYLSKVLNICWKQFQKPVSFAFGFNIASFLMLLLFYVDFLSMLTFFLSSIPNDRRCMSARFVANWKFVVLDMLTKNSLFLIYPHKKNGWSLCRSIHMT